MPEFDPASRIDGWRQQLLDTSRRNRLVNFRSGRAGGIEFAHPSAAALWARLLADGRFTFPWKRDVLGLPAELIDGPLVEDSPTDGEPGRPLGHEFTELCLKSAHLRENHLLTDLSDKQLNARLGRLALAAREAHAEQGVNVLYVAFGFLRWFESDDSDEDARAPLLLVPVRLERDGVDAPWRLVREEDEIRGNDTLAELLRGQFQLALPHPGERQDDPEDEPGWLTSYLPAVRDKVQPFRRWEVQERAALGVFNFQKLAMWEDLGTHADRIAAHPLCRAIAGDTAADLRPPSDVPRAEELDEKVPPQATAQILDADSSQQAAIEAVKRGAHLVLDGPPGTGKSQTIANLIAEFLATGKTVLFVSEKTAALEVVRRRLEACRLGDFCLELHSHRANRRAVLAELGRCLELRPEPFRDPTDDLRKLTEARRELNAYVRELHAPRPPLGRTLFQAHGELAKLDTLKGRSRVAIPDVRNRDATFLDHIAGILARLSGCRAVFADGGKHPWRGCKVAAWSVVLRDDIRFHLDRLAKRTADAASAVEPLSRLGFALSPPTVPGWRAAVAEARAVLAVPVCPPEWFASDPRAAAEAVVRLDAASRRYRDLVPTVPEFDPAAVRSADPAALSTAAATPLGRLPLVGGPPASVRQLAALLRDIGEKLTALAARATTADAAARQAIEATRLSAPVPPFAELAALADQLEAVAALGAFPKGWWEPARRKELLGALGRAVENHAAAQAIRAELVGRVSPAAFAPESAAFVQGAMRFQSLFWRVLLFLGWRSVKEKLKEWYAASLPPTAQLLADLAKLAEFHKLTAHLRQVAAAYPGDLVQIDSTPDWNATLMRLQTADAALAPFPAAAGRDFATPDRDRVKEAAAALRTAGADLRAAWEAAAAVLDVSAVKQVPPRELAVWADAQRKHADAERLASDTAVSLLAAARDLGSAALPERLKAAAELAALAREVATLVGRVEESSTSPDASQRASAGDGSVAGVGARRLDPTYGSDANATAALVKDWSAPAAVADKLLAFLRPHPPAAHLAPALTNPAVRDELARAADRADAVEADGFADSWAFLTRDLFDPDAAASTGVTLNRLPLPELGGWCRDRAADADRLREWTRAIETERDLAAAGLGGTLDEVRRGDVPIDEAADAFRARFLRLWTDAVEQELPELRRFTSADHERLVGRFRDLDRRAMTATPDVIRHRLLTAPARPGDDPDAPASSELGILLKEVHKKARHLPLRKLFAHIPGLLPRVKPCLMMSPLAVSTYLQSPDITFDLVIFDEASQVRPHDAVCAIYRGRQLVVSGDQKQLPPTTFFERGFEPDPREEADSDLKDYESVLDVCCTLGLPRRRLRWHYRSRREGLIAFSNHFFYDGQLVTFPSARDADGTPAVGFHHVPEGRFKDGENAVEARAVAALVLDHFRDHPAQSLGVIAFSQRQQLRILDELETLRKQRPEFEEFFRDDRDDPSFVKNLENVQGDERDVIFLSVGYGPDDAGKVAMRFGPLNRAGGERRLNVAVTRAKERVLVVASMTAADVDLSRTPAEGARLLKAYLDFAQTGTAALARAVTEADRRDYDSPFEKAVAEELERQGLTVHRQVGCGGFRIDLAVLDPASPGRYVLGVECDGAAYHSAATARDRDRLRQAVLEGLGWRICRVWSTDWARDRAGQVRRVLEAVRQPEPNPPAPFPGKEGGEAAADLRPSLLRGGVGEGLASDLTPRPPSLERKGENTPEGSVRKAEFASIDDVPDADIRRLLTDGLAKYGATGTEDLVKRIARQLGFQRTGDKIRARIAATLNELLSEGVVRVSDGDGRVGLSPPNATPPVP